MRGSSRTSAPSLRVAGASMRYTRPLAVAALALALPFILAHCASLLSERLPLKYDAKSVGGPDSGAPLQLWLPPGNGPFPAVLVMHGCGGINDSHRSWAGRLVGWGYAAVIVDSFGPRNQRRVCESVETPSRLIVRGLDAHNAATYLRTLPNIQADQIGIVGFSHGGGATFYGRDRRTHPSRPRRPSVSGGSRLLPPMFGQGRTWSRLPRTC